MIEFNPYLSAIPDELKMNIVSQFLSPFEEPLTLISMGDNINNADHIDLVTAINNIRDEFTDKSETPMDPIDDICMNLSDVFRGKANEKVNDETCVIFLDANITDNVLDILSNDYKYVDELDALLIEKYILNINQEKFVMDISLVGKEKIDVFINHMDDRPEEFNYMLIDNLLTLWIYRQDEIITMIKNI